MSDDGRKVVLFVQSRRNVARLQRLVRELAKDSTQVRVAFEGLGQGEWSDVSDYDVHKLLRGCTLQRSLVRKGELEWVVRARGTVNSTTLIAVTVIVAEMWLVVTGVERV